jgi:D-beta-D-heptose 7-phosphate kinase/D-beta-D-heptose 1-phosphate adenosyltransferase
MEKAILKTLIYADIFDYPLKVQEVHKWLIGKKAVPRQVEKALGRLSQAASIKHQREYYFLRKRKGLVIRRISKERQSAKYLQKAKMLCQILRIIPWIKLVGISGGLALGNASRKDDIDLFIITAKNRLWISRILALGLFSLIGQRRKAGDKGKQVAGKLCMNILLEEDKLRQKNKDIFIGHELLQMKPLWQREEVYGKYLAENEWALRLLPNWVGLKVTRSKPMRKIRRFKMFDYLERVAQKLQLKIMKTPQGLERIEDGALYFHPNDIRQEVLLKYKRKLKELISP